MCYAIALMLLLDRTICKLCTYINRLYTVNHLSQTVRFTLKTLNAKVFNSLSMNLHKHKRRFFTLTGFGLSLKAKLALCFFLSCRSMFDQWMCGLVCCFLMSSHAGHFISLCVSVCACMRVCVQILKIHSSTAILYILCLHAPKCLTTFQVFKNYCTKQLPCQRLSSYPMVQKCGN